MLKDNLIFNKDKFSRYSNIDFDFSSSFEIIGFGDKVYIATPSYIYRTSSITDTGYNFEIIIDYSSQGFSSSRPIKMFEMNNILFVQISSMTYCFDKNGRYWEAGYYITGTNLGNVDGAGYYTLNSEKFPKFIIEEIKFVTEYNLYTLVKTAYFKPISETKMVLEYIKEPQISNMGNIVNPSKILFRNGEVYAIKRSFNSQKFLYIFSFYKITENGYLSKDDIPFLEIENSSPIPENLFYSKGNRIFFFFGNTIRTLDNYGNMLVIYNNEKTVQPLTVTNYKNSTILLTETELLAITNGKHIQKLLTIEEIKEISNYDEVVFNDFKLLDNIAIINTVATVPLGKLNMYFAYNLSSGNIQDLFDIYNDINVTKFFATTENNKVQILQNNPSGKLVNVFETVEITSDKIKTINKSQYEEISGETTIENRINTVQVAPVIISKEQDQQLGMSDQYIEGTFPETMEHSFTEQSLIRERTENYYTQINRGDIVIDIKNYDTEKPLTSSYYAEKQIISAHNMDENSETGSYIKQLYESNYWDLDTKFPTTETLTEKTVTNSNDILAGDTGLTLEVEGTKVYVYGNYCYKTRVIRIVHSSVAYKLFSSTETLYNKTIIIKGTGLSFQDKNELVINPLNSSKKHLFTIDNNELFVINKETAIIMANEIISKNIDGRIVVKIKTSNDYNFEVGKVVKIKDLKDKWVANGSDFEIQGIEEELVGVNFQQTITCVQKYKNSLQS